jgi:AraC family transcriptional regulator
LESHIDRIDVATQSRVPLAPAGTSVLCSGDRWSGIRVQHVHTPAAEWPEFYLPNNVVSALIGEGCLAETWYPGRTLTTWRLPSNSVFVAPARMPIKQMKVAATEGVHVELLPEMFPAGATRSVLELHAAFGVEDPFVFEVLRALRDELRAEQTAGRLYAESLGSALVAHVARRYGAAERGSEAHRGGLAPHGLRLLKDYIDAHLAADLGLMELARLVKMNVDSFIRAFRQSMGLPPHRYILLQRIEKARGLLRIPALSIADVAARSGFGSLSSFSRAFQRLSGLTPRDYRRSL